MCNNVIRVILIVLLFINKFSESIRLFSSDAGTYKQAQAFFTSKKSLIDDHFDGNLGLVTQTIHSHTFVFVMYYANFCGISRRMREPFERAAAFYHQRINHENQTIDKFHVKFAAIDCFYHNGQCRKTYKLNYYPHMFLYVKGTRGYQYFGPTMTNSLIEFIENIRMPVIRLTNIEEFFDFIVQYETNILAQFNFSDDLHRYYYSLFTQTALKHIEYDNEHPIRFAVILNQSIINEINKLYNITLEKPFIILHRLGSLPQIFPNTTNNLTIDNLFQWIIRKYKNPFVGWIVPKNRYYSNSPSIDKSNLVDELTNHDNLLIYFTSNRFDELKLRQIYFHLSDWNQTYSSLWFKQLNQLRKTFIKDNLTTSQRHLLSSCCQYLFNEISTNEIYQICLFNYPFSLINHLEIKTNICLPILENLTLLKICLRSYCQRWLKNSTLIDRNKFHLNFDMILQKRREKFQEKSIEFDDINDSMKIYQGYLHRINSTWTFRLIDSRYYPYFGENLGIINNSKAIIVIQSKNEQHYILNENQINIENIYKLIEDISYNLRSRNLTSISNENQLIKHSNHLIELTTHTFQSIVFNTNKHVLVIYYTKWCGFCQSIWSVIYQTKKFFHRFTDLIFTRIQADKHDLPWHLTVFNYPTIILFPAGRFSDIDFCFVDRKNHSMMFPTSTESITSVNLIKFLLSQLYLTSNIDEQWYMQTNNSFLSMLSSTYVDFSQLSYFIKSIS